MIVPSTETYSLAKGFLNIKNAAHHFDSILQNRGINSRSRNLLTGYKKRLDWILNDVATELTPSSAEALKAEVQNYETLAFDAIADEMLLMSKEQREQFETLAIAFRKGEVKIHEGAK